MSGSTDSSSLAAEVAAILKRRASSAEKPNDTDLVPVYRFLSAWFPHQPATTPAAGGPNGSSHDTDQHWFCPKRSTQLVADAATFLIFLFAFKRVDRSKAYVDALEAVLAGCERCAGSFGAARREFGAL